MDGFYGLEGWLWVIEVDFGIVVCGECVEEVIVLGYCE